eukprot:scaffold2621_cov344-Prasinococcus_capsulatus_cf.AAC.1
MALTVGWTDPCAGARPPHGRAVRAARGAKKMLGGPAGPQVASKYSAVGPAHPPTARPRVDSRAGRTAHPQADSPPGLAAATNPPGGSTAAPLLGAGATVAAAARLLGHTLGPRAGGVEAGMGGAPPTNHHPVPRSPRCRP